MHHDKIAVVDPERLHLLHIDNGLMRKDESREVLETLHALGLDCHLSFVDASDTFLTALAGVVEPERERRIIGDTVIDVFEREAGRLGIEGHLLGQGTIYPDTIETGGTKRADTIKTHHNRVPIVQEMIAAGRVVEPLAVVQSRSPRAGGAARHPARAGVASPVSRAGTRRSAALLDRAGESRGLRPGRAGGCASRAAVWPRRRGAADPLGRGESRPARIRTPGARRGSDAVDPPARGGGDAVQGGSRHQPVPLVLRRHAPPARPLPATVTRERLDLLRDADAMVMSGLRRYGVYDRIWQCPTVLVPLELDGRGRELVIVRPVHSERAMTATPACLPPALLDELRSQVLALPRVSGLAIDVTTKPPGTIEWE